MFDVKTVRRRSWEQLSLTNVPKRPRTISKMEHKPTPKRAKIDIDIDIDAKTKDAGHGLVCVIWSGIPLRAGAPGALGREP